MISSEQFDDDATYCSIPCSVHFSSAESVLTSLMSESCTSSEDGSFYQQKLPSSSSLRNITVFATSSSSVGSRQSSVSSSLWSQIPVCSPQTRHRRWEARAGGEAFHPTSLERDYSAGRKRLPSLHEKEFSQRTLRSSRADLRRGFGGGGGGRGGEECNQPHYSLPQQEVKRRETMIEIAPGLRVRLRGAEETMNAIASDRLATEFCTCCQELLHCVRDADYVLCPNCKVVSPLMENSYSGQQQHRQEGGGGGQNVVGSVGLGMKHDDLCAYRAEIGLD